MTFPAFDRPPPQVPRAPRFERTEERVSLDASKARKAAADAERAELELEIFKGNLMKREEYRAASSVAMSILAQTLRSLPDTLERTHALSPAIAEALQEGIDVALSQVSETFRALSDDPSPS
jgi:hypothetical protein